VGIKYAQAGNRDDSDIEFIHGAAATLLSAGRQGEFDLVVASEVIEHAQDQSSFLQEIHSLLTPKGYLILTTPRQEMKKDWEAAGAEQQPIENWLTREELFSLTKAAGFQIVKYDVGFVEFTNKGVYRLLLSEKVRIASNRWGLSSVLGWLHQRHALYQFLLLRKV
jgi:SAM-dependent methyltransferase